MPNRAGKLFGRVFTAAKVCEYRLSHPRKTNEPAKVRVPVGGRGNIRIYAIARPEPDVEKLSRVLLEVARSIEAEGEESAA